VRVGEGKLGKVREGKGSLVRMRGGLEGGGGRGGSIFLSLSLSLSLSLKRKQENKRKQISQGRVDN
jgi:hypothetical protein